MEEVSDTKAEMQFIKLLLAKSPKLQSMRIKLKSMDVAEESRILKKLIDRISTCISSYSNHFPKIKLFSMASTPVATGWLRGRVKAVPSGDSLLIMGGSKAEIPPENTISLSSLSAPRLEVQAAMPYIISFPKWMIYLKVCGWLWEQKGYKLGKEVSFKYRKSAE
ncbi:hypothetical protein RHMOL_Rhmol01G0043100 [Rhododendron molle]|uniref:Uncharacterized protein n=1 Tax=Rhododendron molle TaxID=49168 RepID=A0ACC0PZV0_RHOML|nr:hypothetical protein RHMOL_Rhmol01G0043100 [Rhododendron molle]